MNLKLRTTELLKDIQEEHRDELWEIATSAGLRYGWWVNRLERLVEVYNDEGITGVVLREVPEEFHAAFRKLSNGDLAELRALVHELAPAIKAYGTSRFSDGMEEEQRL